LAENESGKALVRRMLPRVVKAAAKGAVYFVIFYVLPMFFVSQLSKIAPQLFTDYGQLVTVFAAVAVFFVVASELLAGTIYQHALNIGKAIVFMIFIVFALNGGVVKFDVDLMETQRISIGADLRIYLLALITIDLLGLARSVIQAITFLSEKTEKQLPQPQPAENP